MWILDEVWQYVEEYPPPFLSWRILNKGTMSRVLCASLLSINCSTFTFHHFLLLSKIRHKSVFKHMVA